MSELLPRVYTDLRRIAAMQLRRRGYVDTLQPTSVVNETFLRLFGNAKIDWQCRAHFIAVVATTIRHVLVDHARKRSAAKRGGPGVRQRLGDLDVPVETSDAGLVELSDALERLAALHERQSRVVEMRFFGGMTHEEIAAHLGVSVATVGADWRCARAWLLKEMSGEFGAGA